MEKANAASLIHVDAVSQIDTRWKTSSVFSLISATPVTNRCHSEFTELSNASNVDEFEFVWAEFQRLLSPV